MTQSAGIGMLFTEVMRNSAAGITIQVNGVVRWFGSAQAPNEACYTPAVRACQSLRRTR
jgi:hypothetical protein